MHPSTLNYTYCPVATPGADPAAFAYVVRLRRNGLVGSATASRPAEGYAAAAGGGQAAGNILDWADKTFGQARSTGNSTGNVMSKSVAC